MLGSLHDTHTHTHTHTHTQTQHTHARTHTQYVDSTYMRRYMYTASMHEKTYVHCHIYPLTLEIPEEDRLHSLMKYVNIPKSL